MSLQGVDFGIQALPAVTHNFEWPVSRDFFKAIYTGGVNPVLFVLRR